jgi:hypothetical protein
VTITESTTPTPTAGRGPGRPAIGPKVGPYPVPQELRDQIVAYQDREGFAKQADAARHLWEIGLRGPWPVGDELHARIGAYQRAETFDSLDETVIFLIEDALNAAGY